MSDFENYPFGEEWESTKSFSTPWRCTDGNCFNPSSIRLGYSFEIWDIDQISFEITVNRIAFTSGFLNISFKEQTFIMTNSYSEFIFIGDPTEAPINFTINGNYTYTYCSDPDVNFNTCYETKINTISATWSDSKSFEVEGDNDKISAYNLIVIFSIPIIIILYKIQKKELKLNRLYRGYSA